MSQTKSISAPPKLILGTAMWGWTTPKEIAFVLLDEWYSQGFREVDAATNYPIDKNPGHFRLAEKILLEWVNAHGVNDLEVMMKVGSVNNLRTPEHILTKSFLLMMLDEYGYLFGNNLRTLMVHWDNRKEEDEIRATFEAFSVMQERGFKLGLSGIKHPAIYFKINQEYEFDFRIQVKHNILHSDYLKYADFHDAARFIAYGINAGGLKLNPSEYAENSSFRARGGNVSSEPEIMVGVRDVISDWNSNEDLEIKNFNQIGMIYSFFQKNIGGILLGVSKVSQLKESISFYNTMKENDFSNLYTQLLKLVKS